MACGKKKRRIKKFTLDEISGVDKPCQSPALMMLMKRATDTPKEDLPQDLRKQQEDSMSDEIKKLSAEVENLKKRLEKADALAAMSDEHKEHYASLEGEAQEAFLKMDVAARGELVKKAQESDEVLELDGQQIRKSACDAGVFALLKKQSAETKSLQALLKSEKEAREAAELKKRAEELLSSHPGDMEAKVAMLKSVESIEDEAMRKSALDMLKANNEAMAKALERRSAAGEGSDDSAAQKLEKMAKKYAEDNKVSEADGYAAVLGTDEGKALYAEACK